jgi:DNA-binding transcriptional ArsR family regulator
MTKNQRPILLWDWGTAYDLFASQHVLHHPDKFGLRGAWAAGVRSRLTAPQRTILEDAQELFFSSPLGWVSHLPEPKDVATALWTLSKIPPADRLAALAFHADESPEILETLKQVTDKGAWNDDDLECLQFQYQQSGKFHHSNKWVTILNWWSHAEEFGERYLAAMQAYVAVFFDEEERRIKPYLQQALADAQAMARQLDFSNLFIALSQGVMIAALKEANQVKFVPSYWITPLVMYDRIIKKQWVVLFGARPAHVALVPGEVVPEAMLRGLKALSDPTRLLILRYLSDSPLTQSQLARKLRLRAPTVIHHLSALRLAGLVYVSLDAENEKRYTVRKFAVKDTFDALRKFLFVKGESNT